MPPRHCLLLIAMTLAPAASSLAGAIHDAAENGDVEAVRDLLKKNPKLANDRLQDGSTPLLIASREGFPEVVALLLKSGADPNAQTKETAGQYTPIGWATRRGYKQVALLLIDAGAKLDVPDVFGPPLHDAIDHPTTEFARLLLDKGAKVDARDMSNNTALHKVAREGRIDMARVLLDAKADVNAADNQGWTPLHEAAMKNQVEMARLLVDRGARVNAADRNKSNPLHCALEVEGRKPIVEFLIAKGADVAPKTPKGRDALMATVAKGDVETFEILAKYPFNFRETDDRGRNLMHHAVLGDSPTAKANRDRMVTRLLSLGVPAGVRDEEGKTPADMADAAKLPALAARLRSARP